MARGKRVPSEVRTTSLEALASQLRAWRKRMNWTQVELGEKIGYSASAISGVESTDRAPSADFARAFDKIFDTPGFDEEAGTPGTFLTLYELVAREAYPAFFAPVVPYERQAVRHHGWALGDIPGLLQTEDYARALIESSHPGADAAAVDRLVKARLDRQAVLHGEHPPMLWYVLDEGLLRHLVGGPATMGAQLDALADAAETPKVVIQVLPFTADSYVGTDGSIRIYEFADAPTVCYTECYSGGRIVEAPAEVAELMTILNLIRVSALSPRKSLELIRQIRREIDDGQRGLAQVELLGWPGR
jgi:transcriptional regulator with XRE-family HTH domain